MKSDDGAPDQEVWIDPETLKQGPIQQEDISHLLPMLRWTWRHIGKYATWCRSLEDWELGFMRDSNPDVEVAQWLKITYAMLEFCHREPRASKESAFQAAVKVSNGNPEGIKPKSVAVKLKKLMTNTPSSLANPENYTEDGKFKVGDKHLR